MKSVFQLVRLPAGFSALSNVLAAHILITQGHIQWLYLGLSGIASLCLYFGGMALNDCIDFEEDRRNRANRPLPSGEITLKRAWQISVGLMLSGLLVSALIGLTAFIVAVILATTIVLYNSKVLKGISSAIVMGACRYLNWILAMSIVGLSSMAFEIPLALFFYVTGLTLLSKAETYTESKKPLYLSIAFFSLCFMALLSQVVVFNTPVLWSVLTLSLFIGFLVCVLLPVSQDFTPSTVQGAIGKLVMGVIIVDACVLVIYGFALLAVCILLLLIPGKTLGRWLYVS